MTGKLKIKLDLDFGQPKGSLSAKVQDDWEVKNQTWLTTRKEVYGNKTFSSHKSLNFVAWCTRWRNSTLGDKIVSSTNGGSRIVLATKYFCRLILSTFSDECFRRLNSIWRQISFCHLKIICRRNMICRPKNYRRQNLFLSPNNLYARKFISSPIEFLATKLFFVFPTC